MSGSRIAPACAPGGAPPDGSQGRPDGEQAISFLKRPEVRDVLAWLRLLVDPHDAAAVVRALSRPPIELRQVELARVIQVARRRGGSSRGGGHAEGHRQAGRLDLVVGLAAATESSQVPPEARERIQRFVELRRGAAAELDAVAPDVFVGRLIERLGVRGRALPASEGAAGQRAGLELLHGLAVDFVRGRPEAGVRDLARHLAMVVPDAQGEGRAADRSPARVGEPLEVGDSAGGGDRGNADLEETFRLLREEVLDGVARIGGRLGELRLDTDLDISHGVVRYLELLKLSALLQRAEGQGLEDALGDVNSRLLAAVTPLQREILQTSTLDEALGGVGAPGEGGDVGGYERARAQAIAPREGHSLGPFLPRRGVGLALSASDIHTYRSCPLRYKFARVLRIPTERTVHQRFGIVVHQVLERYHSERGETLARMLELLDAVWRRSALGESEPERELLEKARVALTRYHARLSDGNSQPVWFERAFAFRLGPHHLRGRVDRVDRLAGAEYELIDYKTSRPRTAEQLAGDVQLSLYALAAREAWGLESSRQAYYYVLDDLLVPVRADAGDAQSVKDVVLEVGEGILAQEFEPTPSRAACSICDYRIVCPAAEL